MDILMIVLSVYGAGLLTVGASAAIKDGVSQLDEVKRADAQVKSKTKTKQIFKAIGIFVLAYIVLNLLIMSVSLAVGIYNETYGIKDIVIFINLSLAGVITYFYFRRRLEDHRL